MFFSRFLIGIVAVFVVVLAWTYVDTGSILRALGWAFSIAWIMQAVYFVAVTLLVYGRRRLRSGARDSQSRKASGPFKCDGIIEVLFRPHR